MNPFGRILFFDPFFLEASFFQSDLSGRTQQIKAAKVEEEDLFTGPIRRPCRVHSGPFGPFQGHLIPLEWWAHLSMIFGDRIR